MARQSTKKAPKSLLAEAPKTKKMKIEKVEKVKMAEKTETETEQRILKILLAAKEEMFQEELAKSKKCKMCQTLFTAKTMEIPRNLRCGHTLCEGCIVTLLKDNLVFCPTCKKGSECLNHDIPAAFPMNWNLMNL